MIQTYKAHFKHVDEFDAFAIATSVGNPKGVSVVMLGFFASCLSFGIKSWEKAIAGKVPQNC